MPHTPRRPAALRFLLVAALALVGLAASAVPASAQEAETGAAPSAEAAGAPDCQYPSSNRVTVQAGDTLYGIARRTLCDGGRYLEIFELNRGVRQADGGALTDPSILRVGWVLELPTLSTNDDDGVDDSGNPRPGRRYTVVAGDSLSSIARDQLGDVNRWREIFELNQGVRQADGGALTDPSILRVGWVLQLPSGAGGGSGGGGGGQGARYTVVAGDSLTAIARDELGDATRWREIFDLNRGIRQPDGGTLTDPSVLRVGWILRLPPR